MSISAKQVKELRDRSGVGMMDCKISLEEAAGDIDKAFDILRKSGIAKAQKKAGRSAKDGNIISYIHPGAKLGVLLEINCETDFVSDTDEFKELCKNVAMHIAATNPIAVKREDVSKETLDKEKEIYLEQAKSSNKPENIIEKMVEGRINKYFKENVLLEQDFVKDPNQTIKDLVTNAVSKLGENIVISRFSRYQLGENK